MRFDQLSDHDVAHGEHISTVLDELARDERSPWDEDCAPLDGGVAFVTFAYDIDGVSMEIAKYARCFERIRPGLPIHCIAGNFGGKADAVLAPNWHRFVLDGADGWDKWDSGTWFHRLFYEDLPLDSPQSSELASQMWDQALSLAGRLVAYLDEHGINLLFTVNTNSNPGNVAFGLALVLASETSGVVVINNNHDFYWEGGKAGCKRNPGEEPGPRDHFFRNHDNEEFFAFFQRIYPWNGRRWAQVDINTLQSRRLIDRFHFPPDRVFTIGTGVDPAFFRARTPEVVARCRAAMSRVLGGDPVIPATSIERFVDRIGDWMADQRPVVCGRDEGRTLDMTAPEALVLLQPTRVVERKRIWKDWELIGALLRHPSFRDVFVQRPSLTLTLQITGPVPIEHRECLETVIAAYRETLAGLPDEVGGRVFLAMSAGWQSHPALAEELDIVDIYQLADLVVFPSQTEGRGLPIVEASAAGVPIICSRYEPNAVFAEVVGERLSDGDHLAYELYPEEASTHDIDGELLDRVSRILLDPASQAERIAHNREAVLHRFSFDALQASIESVVARLESTVRSH
jgi:glycosyltransferase involved in cell wall biosynthesis